ncbi:MAG: hypothetical protein HXL45_04555, partial [Solobacterium sp.]|nr:hypothetical protein [Solobacterium sp.]
VKERPLEGYIATVTGDQENGYIITNFIPRTPPTADHFHVWPLITVLSISLVALLLLGLQRIKLR